MEETSGPNCFLGVCIDFTDGRSLQFASDDVRGQVTVLKRKLIKSPSERGFRANAPPSSSKSPRRMDGVRRLTLKSLRSLPSNLFHTTYMPLRHIFLPSSASDGRPARNVIASTRPSSWSNGTFLTLDFRKILTLRLRISNWVWDTRIGIPSRNL